jgi:DNA-binding response OmpR family regulator
MRETILLVDDDESVRELSARILERRGFRVILASDGVQALALSSDEPDVHLLVTDVVMPKLGGVELAKKLRELRPATRVLFMTGLAPDRWDDHHVEGPVLRKPFVLEDLADRVRAALQ